MPAQGIPVVIATNGIGVPVKPVTDRAPLMTVATNGLGTPIVISDLGAPFVVDGYSQQPFLMQGFLATESGDPIITESDDYVETY